jgi:hypothetical protein
MSFSLPQRLWLFLYGWPNIVGCSLALLGVGLHFFALLGPGWLPIVAGLYGIGWLATWLRLADKPIQTAPTLEIGQLLVWVQRLRAQVEMKIPHDSLRQLDSIIATLSHLVPKLEEFYARESWDRRDLFLVQRIVSEYLPNTLNAYMRLPPAYSAMHRVAGRNQTPRELLLEQMTLLDEQLEKILENALAEDVDAMLANEHFLQERFQAFDFLDTPRPP